MNDIVDKTNEKLDFIDSCKLIVKSDKTPIPDLIYIVNTWVSDEEESIELIKILNMGLIDRNKYFKSLTGHSDWFIDELCKAVFKSNLYDDDVWTPIESSPEALVVSSKLNLKFSNQFKTKSLMNRKESHLRVKIQTPLNRVFQSLVKSIGPVKHTIDVIIEYGLSKHVSLIGDFKHIHGLREINTKYAEELNIVQPGKYTEAITGSMKDLFIGDLCKISTVMNSMDTDVIDSTKVDFDTYSLFMGKVHETGLNSSELFSLYLLAFIADSDSGRMHSLVSDQVSNYFSNVLMEYKKLLNNVSSDLSVILQMFLSTSVVYGTKFNDTINLLSKMAVRDSYYRTFYDIINKNNDNQIVIYTDKEYKATNVDSLISDMNNTLSTYMLESKNARKDLLKVLKDNDALSIDNNAFKTKIDLLSNDNDSLLTDISTMQVDIDLLSNELNTVKLENAQLKKNSIHTLIIRIKAFFKKGVNINGL